MQELSVLKTVYALQELSILKQFHALKELSILKTVLCIARIKCIEKKHCKNKVSEKQCILSCFHKISISNYTHKKQLFSEVNRQSSKFFIPIYFKPQDVCKPFIFQTSRCKPFIFQTWIQNSLFEISNVYDIRLLR